ncbi:tRNA (uracil-5-)-methyltransferase homolog B-like [Macrobrachium rosenbergii]|uniref:tRNA (uracil-5-)-methyltransferase homolog B-like n=1 Tax=Macrobrachium rosenbergii TaxID=79674 RepID=UPI0034D55D59
MNVVRQRFHIFRPQTAVRRGLRGNPRRHGELEKPINSVSSPCNIPILQAPLTEEELKRLSRGGPEHESVKEKAQPKNKHESLQEKVSPTLNRPMSEPVTAENQYERLAQVVTPLYQVPYGQQLKMKQGKVNEIMKALGEKLKSINAPITRLKKGLPCPVEPIRPSPDVIAYRNKDEFGVHIGVDGNPKTVGFYVGKPVDPLMTCVPSTYLINMKESHKDISKKFQTFIRQSSHDACHRFDTTGVWRNFLVRSTRSDERMATVYIHPQDLTKDEKLEIMDDLRNFFFHGEGTECELDSLYMQACRHTRCTREQAPYELIEGKEYITETCEGLSFRISPDSFFQINTGGAEVLYRTVREIAEVSPLTTLLDVCCGTGTISLVMAPYVRGSVGIEVTTGAVLDAKENAIINNIPNAHFIAGAAEKVLPRIAPDLNCCSDVVAIMNPARAGLRPEVIRAIRQCEAITKLVYISCKPEGSAMENFVQLASTQGKGKLKDRSPPFLPKYAVPVDMFPHTHHTEVVILFERLMS